MRYPFASNRYFQLLLAAVSVAVAWKIYADESPNEKMRWFLLLLCAAVFLRSLYRFFSIAKMPDGGKE